MKNGSKSFTHNMYKADKWQVNQASKLWGVGVGVGGGRDS